MSFLLLCSFSPFLIAEDETPKKVLILVEGNSDLKNKAMGDGRQLEMLMGHFSTSTTLKGVNQYTSNEMASYDRIFYIGYSATNVVPQKFLDDVMHTSKQLIWLNTGFIDFCKRYDVKKKFGFTVSRLDSVAVFDMVKVNQKLFTKGEPITGIIEIADRRMVSVGAVAYSSTKRSRETPYMVKSGNLMYFADSPFASATESDRYLYFADLLHDILEQPHEESHSALIRIEDVTPLDNPEKLRDIADILSSRGVPFLVSVIPFYVNPGEGIRVSLSDKPDLVDALKYMVKNGGTIVMHGIYHRYKGVTAADFEFWDESTNKPIKDETAEGDAQKVELGIQELLKNGLQPLAWETPHYTASFLAYSVVAKYFSTAIEQRLAIEDFDYSQAFPYIIQKDLFGQQIFPENLGYVPLSNDPSVGENAVKNIIKNAKTNLYVRDGFASAFFHSFLDLNLLKELVDGVRALGYTYIDLRDYKNWVKTKDRIILSGSQDYTIDLNDQYLLEAYYDHQGEIRDKIISDTRMKGKITKSIQLGPGEFYKSEPVEFRGHEASMVENISRQAKKVYESVFSIEESWNEARVAILWNHYAKGAAFNDQASFASAFQSVGIPVDTFFIGQQIQLTPYNVLIVPYAFVDSLKEKEFDLITDFVNNGGYLITDTKNDLAENFGIKFTNTYLHVIRIRDRYFPEEHITWRYADLLTKFDAEDVDEVFCHDETTDAPVVIGKRAGKGKVIFIGTRFDSYSQLGYSQFPYLMEYVRKYFGVRPIMRRDRLEMYFEPGFRHTWSVEQLVKLWVNEGIRIIHVSGWHQYPKYTIDYDRLVRLAHANGILVYAWIEPPQVSQMFWQNHPEWREKNYKNEDIRPSWRYPVALTDEKCLAAMTDEYKNFLSRYDFDGVNLAEMYFDAAKGFNDPKFFTPMHPSAIKEFKQKYGIDLPTIFDPASPNYWKTSPNIKNLVTDYRVQKLEHAYDVLLTMISDIAKSRDGYSVIVTAFDSYGSPELREYIGNDMTMILALQKKYQFTLQVEDPESLWSTSPLRYIELGKRYENLVSDSSKLSIDLNIGPFRKPNTVTPFPTLTQTGIESYLLIRATALGSDRSTIYSEASTNPQDMSFLAYAFAARAQYDFTNHGYTVNSPYAVSMKLPKAINGIAIDGIAVSPFRDNVYLIPAGNHTIDIRPEGMTSFSTHELQTKLMSLTGNLLSVSYGLRDITFQYESSMRTLASFNREPTSVVIDGKSIAASVMKGTDCYTIFLPQGKHKAHIVAGDQFSYDVNLTSLWSTTAIALFGSLAVMLLVALYLALKVVKRRYGA